MLAQKNPDIDNAVTTMFTLSNEKLIKEQMWAREDYYRRQRTYERMIKEQEKELADQKKTISEKDKLIAELKAQLAAQK